MASGSSPDGGELFAIFLELFRWLPSDRCFPVLFFLPLFFHSPLPVYLVSSASRVGRQEVISQAALVLGVPTPAFSTALAPERCCIACILSRTAWLYRLYSVGCIR